MQPQVQRGKPTPGPNAEGGRVDVFMDEVHRDIVSCGLAAPAANPGRSALIRSLLDRATADYGRQNWLAAADHLKQAIEMAPTDSRIHGALGSLRCQLKDYPAALASLTMAVGLAPKDPDLHVQLAMVQLRLNRPAAAEAALGRALELRPEDPTALKLLADSKREHGHYQEAALIYGKLIHEHPDQVGVLLSLAQCFFALGDREGTHAALEHALAVDPHNAIARDNLAVLQAEAKARPTLVHCTPTSAPARLELDDISTAGNGDRELKVAQPSSRSLTATDSSVPIIAGHSHSACLGVPLGRTHEGASQIVALENGDRRFCGFLGKWPRVPGFWGELAQAARGRTVILVWQGNQHLTEFLLMPSHPLDFVLSEDPSLDLDPDAEIVPELAIQTRLAAELPGLTEIIALLRKHGSSRVIVSGTPAPRRDRETMRKGILGNWYFPKLAEQFGFRIEEIPISAPLFQYKLWRVLQRLIRDAALRQSAEFLPVADATLQDGFLREEFGSVSDWMHTNETYGRLMLDHFHAYLNRESP